MYALFRCYFTVPRFGWFIAYVLVRFFGHSLPKWCLSKSIFLGNFSDDRIVIFQYTLGFPYWSDRRPGTPQEERDVRLKDESGVNLGNIFSHSCRIQCFDFCFLVAYQVTCKY